MVWCLVKHKENFTFILSQYKLKASEIRVLRRIFGPKRKEEAGGWRGGHNEGLHNLYASQNVTRVIK
jgi:hypothetical protein